MKIKLYFICFYLLILASCNDEKELLNLIGKYAVTETTFRDKLFLKIHRSDGRIIGSELTLMHDKTFVYSTCGNIMTGQWTLKDNDVTLIIQTNQYKSDSLQVLKGGIVNPKTINFKIIDKQLFRKWEFRDDSTSTIELLTKE
jgi:hypothetical protein